MTKELNLGEDSTRYGWLCGVSDHSLPKFKNDFAAALTLGGMRDRGFDLA